MRIARCPSRRQSAYALILVVVLTSIALMTLGAAMTWTSNTRKLTIRNCEFFKSVAAAEAATEKVVGLMASDFRNGNQARVLANLDVYRASVPLPGEEGTWSRYAFTDLTGYGGRLTVTNLGSLGFTNLGGAYRNLRGSATGLRVAAAAQNLTTLEQVRAVVQQEVQLATIPIFQFAIFYNILLEISCGQPFNIRGPVHANQDMYVLPDNALTFWDVVEAAGDITFSRAPGDGRGPPTGSVSYKSEKTTHVSSLSLPIGTNNTPAAILALLDMPPTGEDPGSAIGKQRFYNKADLIITVSNLTTTATSGRANSFSTVITNTDLAKFVSTAPSFWDARESRTVRSIDIDVGSFTAWNNTNGTLRPALGREAGTVYVIDKRTLSSTEMGGVRLINGRNLPTAGLTVVTPQPLYVFGHYNCYSDTGLGSTNTAFTRPAALIGDAITILSTNWKDSNSKALLSSRSARPTTVNAAFLAGIVETDTYASYSGGVENFPRFLETWGSANIFTYNGSIVGMFPSRYATAPWGLSGVYSPPARNWSFDVNFRDASKLPPSTPSVTTLIRSGWATLRN